MAHKPQGEEVVATWSVPFKGVLRTRPAFLLPDDALYDALNVLVRDGQLRPRPGLSLFNSTDLLDRPMGVFNTVTTAVAAFQADAFQSDAFQMGGNVPSSTLMAGTVKRVWAHFGGIWNDKTDTVLNGTDRNHVRFAALEIAGVIQTVITNGVDAPRSWNGSAATVSVVAGSPPLWTDIAVASDRIIGIVPPYTIQWGNALTLATWPALNVRMLADTPDQLRAIRQVGTQGAAVYKARSIWSGFATGGTDAQAFRFDLRMTVDGPAGPAAVVETGGPHLYMTDTGRVGAFDGASHRWVADGVWPIIRADLDVGEAVRITGHTHPLTGIVTFHYPRVGDAGEVKGCLVVIPPMADQGVADYIAFPCRMSVSVTAAGQRWADAQDVLALLSGDRKSYKIADDIGDAGLSFSGYWQSGLKPMAGLDPHRVESLEVMAERGSGYGSLIVKPVTSDMLAEPGGVVGAGRTVDLTATPVKEAKGFDAEGRFIGARHEFTTPITLRWNLTRLAARRQE